MSMLDRLRSQASAKFLFEVVEDEAVLRSEPRTDATEVGILEFGRAVLVRDLQPDGWGRLDEDEVWASGIVAPEQNIAVLTPSEDEALLPVFVLIDGSALDLPKYFRRSVSGIEDWEYFEALQCAEASGLPWRRLVGGLRPKKLLDLAWLSPWHTPDGTILEAPPMLHDDHRSVDRPLPRLCVASMVRGITGRCLESLILHHHNNGFENVMLYFDTPDEPGDQEAIAVVEKFTQPMPTGPGGLLCHVTLVLCTEAWWSDVRKNSRYYIREHEPLDLYRQTVHLDADINDVQARQMLCIEHALSVAERQRYEWLLHVDTDEVLFFPDQDRHADARSFFREVPLHFSSVRFANLEAVPETLEVGDPFEEVSLFKMNPLLLEELGVEPRILACGDVAAEDEEHEQDLFDRRHADAVPGGFTHGYVRLPRKERHALRRLLSIMHDIAGKRAPVLESLKVKLDAIAHKGSGDNSDSSDDESCFGPRPDCPAYFNSYSNGKCAVRTQVGPRGELPPLPAGVHGFIRDGGMGLYTLLCKGPGAPVMLHYCNCGFADWCRKYEILCQNHGTADGAFSTDREGIAEVRSHLAARQLTLQGDPSKLQRFYETFIQGNAFDEMSYLAQFGLALRLNAPRQQLEVARQRLAQILQST